MDRFFPFFPAIILLIVFGAFAWRYFKYGSMVGMIVGARVLRTVGSVESERAFGVRMQLGVHVLERQLGGPTMVAIGETSKSFAARKYTAVKFTIEQARELARLLELAAKG